MRGSILQNIIAFQQQSALLSGAQRGMGDGISWVMNAPGHWPYSIIGTPNEIEIKEFIGKIERKQIPPFWIMENQISAPQIAILLEHGFREIERWEGMSLNRDDFIGPNFHSDNFHIHEVADAASLSNWLNVVKPVLMPNKILSKELLNSWVNRDEFILLTGMEGNQPVSAGMAFLNDQSAGLYFIVTLPSFIGKGYASNIVSKLIGNCFSKGYGEIVLHATQVGKTLYQKLGFVPEGTISTYWKLGLF